MAKKKKSPSDIIYEIKDLLDDLELQVNPEDNWDEEDDLDEDDLDIDDDEEE
jgi:hypothetical protein